jgi:putative NADH-flavin reductase
LIGATGPLGSEVLRQATDKGLRLRALVRRPVQTDPISTHETVIGDVLQPSTLSAALQGIDAVICVLGTPLTRQPVRLLSEGTSHLLAAMKTVGVSRLLCVTGMGAGDSRGHGGFIYDHLILPYLLGEIYKDKDRQEALIKDSATDWTLVRPARLTNAPSSLKYQEITNLSGQSMSTISRADVAHFLLDELRHTRYVKKTVNLTA